MVNVYQATLVVFIVKDTRTTFRKRNEYCEIATKDILRIMGHHSNHGNSGERIRHRQSTSHYDEEYPSEPTCGWKQGSPSSSSPSSPMDAHVPEGLVRERSLSN